MQIGLIVNTMRGDAVDYARQAAEYLQSRGAQVFAEGDVASRIGPDVKTYSKADNVQAIISLGGDGTLLRGAQFALRWDSALLGINLGRVGFLTHEDPSMLDEALQAVLDERYEIEERPMLSIKVGRNSWHALNDAVLHRGGNARLITINAIVDGESCGRYVADGIVVATPTGSTGYSLSAGGPVVSPKVDCMVITPICAHTLQHRPAVVHGGARVTLELMPTDEQTAALEVDGQTRCEMTRGMKVEIRMDKKRVRLIRLQQEHFFQLVREKLTEWTR